MTRFWRFERSSLGLALLVVLGAGCGADRIQHTGDGGLEGPLLDAGVLDESDGGGVFQEGSFDAGRDAGTLNGDSGEAPDAGESDAGQPDAGQPEPDAGASTPDAGVDAGCTPSGVSPQLSALNGGPYQNCVGGTIPRVDTQSNTTAWSGCCGDLVRVCAVSGYSTQNVLYCQ